MISSIGLCLGYCACQSASSLCQACFGNSDPSTTGRKRSILLLAIAVALSLIFQYSWAPSLHGGNSITRLPYIGTQINQAWNDDCYNRFHEDLALLTKCRGNSGVYRATFTSTLFFLCMAIATKINPILNRSAWPAKYVIFLLFVMATFFIPNSPLFFGIFPWICRLGASLFLVVQQIILIDLAYSWNESWVQNSIDADSVEYGSGNSWLIAIVVTIVLLYSGCLVSLVLLYKYFSGCATNDVLISMTLVLIVSITAIQLNSEGGNLLTSSVLSVYAIYLVTSALSHNPNEQCNLFFGNNGTMEIIFGMTLTFLSLVWTGWSWTDERILTTAGMKNNASFSPSETKRPLDGLDIPMLEEQNNYVGGVVMDQPDDFNSDENLRTNNELWKLNVVLALVSCWIAVSLTGWGSIQAEGDVVNLWIIAISQWMALGLYAWTLAAPSLFPDRNFS